MTMKLKHAVEFRALHAFAVNIVVFFVGLPDWG
jgi:hypothetical protein